MRKLLLMLACGLLAAAFSAQAFAQAPTQAAYVHEMSGTASARTGNAAPRPLKVGDIIGPGQTIATGEKSTMVIKFEDGQLVALAANSSFTVQEYAYNKQNISASRAVFNVIQGGLRFVTGVIGATNRNAVSLRAGTATIGIRGTDLVIHMDALTQAITLAVRDGAALLNGVPIAVNQFGLATPGTKPAVVAANVVSAIAATLTTALNQVNVPTPNPVNVAASARAVIAAAQLAADPTNPTLKQAADTALQEAVTEAVAALQAAITAGGVLPPAIVVPVDPTLPPPDPTKPILVPSPS